MVDICNYIGYKVEVARNRVEALGLYQKTKDINKPFDAVIFDVSTNIKGREILENFLAIDPGAKVIASTDCFDELIISDLKRLGFKDVICKPYEIKIFKEILAKVIAGGSD